MGNVFVFSFVYKLWDSWEDWERERRKENEKTEYPTEFENKGWNLKKQRSPLGVKYMAEVVLLVDDLKLLSGIPRCRICHEEEFESIETLEAPCACSGTVKVNTKYITS